LIIFLDKTIDQPMGHAKTAMILDPGMSAMITFLTCGFLERVTGIEPALSAWE
jgi:hypothetical protein